MIDQNFFSSIQGGRFELGGDKDTGLLYHWIWDNSNTTEKIDEFLLKKRFIKGQSASSDNATAEGRFTRVEMRVNDDPNETKFHVEYFDGNKNCTDQIYTRSAIKSKIDILTCISVFGSVASIVGVVLSILCSCK